MERETTLNMFSALPHGEALRPLLTIGSIATEFATVQRAPYYREGRRETDTDHTVHLGLTATHLAVQLYPDQLDPGRVVLMSMVHDLVEVYAGDTRTFGASAQDLMIKEVREKRGFDRLSRELPPSLFETLTAYETQIEPEARFVRVVDKFLPAIINTVNLRFSAFLEDYGVYDAQQVEYEFRLKTAKYADYFVEFPEVLVISQAAHDYMMQMYFDEHGQPYPHLLKAGDSGE